MVEDVMLNSDSLFFFLGLLQLTGNCGIALENLLKTEVLYLPISSWQSKYFRTPQKAKTQGFNLHFLFKSAWVTSTIQQVEGILES